mmetsp:Transcript_36698/g.54677  ORF Transcript_36698/g.54677 Transcript_36698/m.54677 type:complete len:97 (-) Transcript_36698:111-401(-)
MRHTVSFYLERAKLSGAASTKNILFHVAVAEHGFKVIETFSSLRRVPLMILRSEATTLEEWIHLDSITGSTRSFSGRGGRDDQSLLLCLACTTKPQ